MKQFTVRPTIRTCTCRLCERVIERGSDEKLVFWYTYIGGSRTAIILCKGCIDTLKEAMNESLL